MKYIDIHSHLGFEDYGKDQKETIERMREAHVATITIGTGLKSSKEAVKLAEGNKNIWACIGAHPDENSNEVFDEREYEKLVKSPKVVAIGECGLDYFRLKEGDKEKIEKQKAEFIKQIEFAVKFKKPLMLHIRDRANSEKVGQKITVTNSLSPDKAICNSNFLASAYSDAYEILKNYRGKVEGNLHFFAGSIEWAKKFIELGYTISFTGVITFARQYDEVIKNILLEHIHAETDAPFVAPTPYRGKRNEPSYVVEVVKKIAEIRGEDLEKVRDQLLLNSKRVFGV